MAAARALDSCRQRRRPLEAEHRHEGPLLVGRIRPGRLPEHLRRPGRVEHVVDDLEAEADLPCQGAIPGGDVLGCGGELQTDLDRRLDQPSRLEPAHVSQLILRRCRVHRQVEMLPADHPVDAACQRHDGGDTLLRPDVEPLRQNPVGGGEQRITDQDGLVLAVDDVRRRTSAPGVIVVERRKIVVDQRERVNQLDSGRRGKRALDVAAQRANGGEEEERTKSLPARIDRVQAHRLEGGHRHLGREALDHQRPQVGLERLCRHRRPSWLSRSAESSCMARRSRSTSVAT